MAGRTDKFDWVTFALYISTLVIGWLMLYAVSFSELENGVFSFDSTIGKQTMWLGLALVVFLLCQIIDSRFWKTVAIPIYGFSIILLIAVLIFGVELKGARSWFSIFGLSFQPSEIAKFATILALASYLDHYETRLSNYKAQLVSVGLIALPAGLILLQPDAGSALSFSALMILLYREGMPGTYFASAFFLAAMLIAGFILPMPIVILAIFCLASFVIWTSLGKGKSRINFGVPILLLLLNSYHLLYNDIGNPIYLINGVAITYLLYMAWNNRQQQILWTVPTLIFLGALTAWFSNYAFNNVLEIHQQDRINVWLQPDKCDPQGALYNIIQSKVAIGSGGFMGKGFLGGTMTKLNYVPEQATDFIFTTIGEEQGFLGSVGVIIIFFAMIMRIVYLGEKKQNSFIRNYGYGLAGLLFFHVFINIGMTMGLVPIIGIPLPFVSKGGTALLSFSIILSVYLKLLASRR